MSKSLIFLHGLGDKGSSWYDLHKIFNGYHCILPDAPSIPIYLNGNMEMPGWYNIYQLTGTGKEDEEGILKTRQVIRTMIQKEMDKGVLSKNIFIGGFSQGAVMALFTGLTSSIELGGIIALSGYLPIREYTMRQQLNDKIPIFMAHGKQDDVIPYRFSQLSKKALLSLNLPLTYKDYDMGHSALPEELDDVKQWLQSISSRKEEL